MSHATLAPPAGLTAADLADRFGPMPLARICFDPFPGTATEQDLLDLCARTDRLYELVDGILVEKAMGYAESALAAALIGWLRNWVTAHNLGAVAGPDGMMRLAPGLIRYPDVSFVAWDRFPNRQLPTAPIADLAPDLAAEVLSVSNTATEMTRKLQEYFDRGVRLVWYIDPRARTVEVYESPDQARLLREGDTLDGGAVLPGFQLSLRQLFAELDPH